MRSGDNAPGTGHSHAIASDKIDKLEHMPVSVATGFPDDEQPSPVQEILQELVLAAYTASSQDVGPSIITRLNDALRKALCGNRRTWQSRAELLAFVAMIVRRVLVADARRRCIERCSKLSGPAEVTDGKSSPADTTDVILSVDEAITRLHGIEPRMAQVVELRYFGGMSEEEVAAVLGVAPRTVSRDWRLARAWIHAELRGAVHS